MVFRSVRSVAIAIAVMLSCSTLAAGQSSTGSIAGAVEDESQSPVPGVLVTVTKVDTGVTRTVTTDSGGRYHSPELIPGPYEVQAQLEGFQTAVRKGVVLTVGSQVVVNLVLAVGKLTETTVVTAQAPLVEVTNATMQGLVDEKTIRDLPLNGRSFDQLITLEASAPMINARGRTTLTGQGNVFSVGGARTQSNQYLMDGTELVGAGSATTQPGGALGKNMGVEAIQEFTVLTGSYSAAYGKRAGGVINIATRSGTNQLHGSAFEFHRNDAFDARNFFDPGDAPPFTRNQFGGAMGGPLKHDRTFFFANYEALRETLGLSKIAIVPDDNARRGLLPDPARPGTLRNVGVAPGVAAYMALIPPVNGRNFGDGTAESINSVTRLSHQDFGLVRVDHKLSDRDSVFGRYNLSQASLNDPADNPYFTSVNQSRDQMLTVEEKRVYQKWLNSARFGFTRARIFTDSTALVDIDPSLVFLPGAKTIGPINYGSNTAAAPLTQMGTDTSAERYFIVNQYDLQDQLFYYHGSHSVKVGAQLQRIQHDENFQNSVRGAFEFADFESFLRGRPTVFRAPAPSEVGGTAAKDYRLKYFSTFVQDDWAVHPGLTLNLGLRYELMTVPVEADDNRISNYRADIVNGTRVLETAPILGSPFFQDHHRSFAPRVGFAWDPSGHGATAVRGGFGVFYDQVESEFRFFTANNAPFFSLMEVRNGTFPGGFAAGSGAARTPAPDGVDFNIQVPTRRQWNLGIERQLTSNTMFNIGYVGSSSYNLMRLSDANTAAPQILADGTKYYAAGLKRKNPALGGSRFITTDADASYQALQFEFNQRITHGLRSKVSVTYGKTMDDASAVISQHSTASPAATQDPDNPEGDRGLSAYDVRRNFVANFTYDVPVGDMAGAARALLGGWQVSGILTLQDGTPFTVLDGYSRSRDLARSAADRPNLKAGASANPVLGGPDQYFDPSGFELQPIGTYGNLGRNTMIGPGLQTIDCSVVRIVPLGHARLDMRLEMFNLLNRANFGLPDASLFTTSGLLRGAAGRINNTSTTSRQVQIGAKLTF